MGLRLQQYYYSLYHYLIISLYTKASFEVVIMSSFGPSKSRNAKGSSPSKLSSTGTEVIKTMREREVENRVKEIAKLKAENEALMQKIEEQDSEIVNLSSQNQQLSGELEDVKKEYVDLEKSFEESIGMLKQMKLKVRIRPLYMYWHSLNPYLL